MRVKSILGLALLVCLWLLAGPPAGLAAQRKAEPAEHKVSPKASSDEEETEALRKAFRSAESNPQVLIKNLEDFLTRFPASPRREKVVRAIYEEALQANAPNTALVYGEKLLELDPDNARLLATLMDLLDHATDAADGVQSLESATRLIQATEKQSQVAPPREASEADWKERWSQKLAALYARRGLLYEKSSETEKALADFQKSYSIYPGFLAAERMGDLAAKNGELDRAIDFYATAFAFPDRQADQLSREEVRHKLGKLYVEQHHSEQGLGDLILSRYDQLVQQFGTRLQSRKTASADTRDPYDFVLRRPDGSSLNMGDFRGKVLVVDFWATWCPPCRVEGKLLASVMESFQGEPRAAFLSLNLDDDPASVQEFLKKEQWTVPVAYGMSLARLLRVTSLPTVIIFDQNGRIVFRQEGVDFASFVSTLEKKVREALQTVQSSSASTGR